MIATDEDTFQPRFGGLVERQVADLQDVLRRGGDLDPVALWEDPDTKQLIVADGHHRLEALRRERPGRRVSVKVYRCERQTAAWVLPMIDNAKTRLVLTYDEKANRAWRMTAEDAPLSAQKVANLCGISKRTVATMRQIKAQLLQAEDEPEELPRSWLEARRIAEGDEERKEWSEDYREARKEAELKKADEAIGALLSALFRRWPEVAADLVARCAGENAMSKLIDDYGAVMVVNTAEGRGLLAMRMGEEFSPVEIDAIAAEAKKGPAF